MKLLRGTLLAAVVWLTGCASIGPPMPPSLELPRAPSDLRAVRKGDKVTLTWSIPARTVDRQKVRYLGKTNICRSLDPVLAKCDRAVGEAEPPVDFASKNAVGGQKLTGSYTDTLPLELRVRDVFGSATYAVEVLNRDGRAAGCPNQLGVRRAEIRPAQRVSGGGVRGQGGG